MPVEGAFRGSEVVIFVVRITSRQRQPTAHRTITPKTPPKTPPETPPETEAAAAAKRDHDDRLVRGGLTAIRAARGRRSCFGDRVLTFSKTAR